jgi:hypothetical protein
MHTDEARERDWRGVMETSVARPIRYLATVNVMLAVIAIAAGATAYFLYEILVALKIIIAIA